MKPLALWTNRGKAKEMGDIEAPAHNENDVVHLEVADGPVPGEADATAAELQVDLIPQPVEPISVPLFADTVTSLMPVVSDGAEQQVGSLAWAMRKADALACIDAQITTQAWTITETPAAEAAILEKINTVLGNLVPELKALSQLVNPLQQADSAQSVYPPAAAEQCLTMCTTLLSQMDGHPLRLLLLVGMGRAADQDHQQQVSILTAALLAMVSNCPDCPNRTSALEGLQSITIAPMPFNTADLLADPQYQRISAFSAKALKLDQELTALKQVLKKESIAKRKYKNELEDMKGNIRVFARCRPISKQEIERGCALVAEVDTSIGKITITSNNKTKEFEFDCCFDGHSSQQDVFGSVQGLLESFVDGFNVCLFTYGQTGSGKRFTMFGAPNNLGLLHRSAEEVFSILSIRDPSTYTVVVQLFELYMDQLIDLIWRARNGKKSQDEPPKLEIKVDPKKGVVVRNAERQQVRNYAELVSIYEQSERMRSTSATLAGATASRSHSIFMIELENMFNNETQTTSRLSFVDLAGSERASKTGATAIRLKEAQAVNKALSALGDVIAALSSGEKFVPYRNNKLTQLMQDSLGGNAKTVMIVHFAPTDVCVEETLTSLSYAARAKLIKNTATDAGVPAAQVQALQAKLVAIEKENQELKAKQTASVVTSSEKPTAAHSDAADSSEKKFQAMVQAAQVKSIPWSELELDVAPRGGGVLSSQGSTTTNATDALTNSTDSAVSSASTSASNHPLIIGSGAYGVVVRLLWHRRLNGRKLSPEKVAVKVLTKNQVLGDGSLGFEDIVEDAIEEANMILGVEKEMANNDFMIRVFGVSVGALPKTLTDAFHLKDGEMAVGIVMRFEGGGALEGLLHPAPTAPKHPLPIAEKLRILVNISHGLADLHLIGIVHGDLKPDNVLLSEHNPPMVRLADFGLAAMRGQLDHGGTLGNSSLSKTHRTRGTPLYAAPEMLVNPFDDEADGTVARSSRSTDMYAFALIMWEVLARKKPFSHINNFNETMLVKTVHKGKRPPMADIIEINTPPMVVDLIERCWSSNRADRQTATECFSILDHAHSLMVDKNYDIFFSHAWMSKPFLSQVKFLLNQSGYRVWYDQNDIHYDLQASMRDGIANSKVFLACVDKTYQGSKNCMFELNHAVSLGKQVVALTTEAHVPEANNSPFLWVSDDLQQLCGFASRMFVDVGKSAAMAHEMASSAENWDGDEGPVQEMMKVLAKELEALLKVLRELECRPSLLT